MTSPTFVSCMLLVLGATSLAACQVDTSCYREIDDTGQTVVTCPRQDPVVLQTPPSDAQAECFYSERVIACGEDLYDLQGRTLSPDGTQTGSPDAQADLQEGAMTQDMSEGDGSDPSTQEFVGRLALPHQSSCNVVGSLILCQDGARASLPGQLEGQMPECISKRLPGHGQRIICTTGDGASGQEGQREVIVPEQGSIPEDSRSPSCQITEDVLSCTEGSVAIGEDVKACKNPRIKVIDVEVVMDCFEQEKCPLALEDEAFFACIEDNEKNRSPACQEALAPPIVCDDGVEVTQLNSCTAPEGVFHFGTREDVRFLERVTCPVLQGDVLFAPKPEKTPGGRVDVMWTIPLLREVDIIRGSLRVEEGMFGDPDGNGNMDDVIFWEGELAQSSMRYIGGDLVFRDIEGLVFWHEPNELRALDGNMMISENPDLAFIELNRRMRGPYKPIEYTRGLQITANPRLQGLSVPRKFEMRGIFVMLDNNALNACKMGDLWEWGVRNAQAIWLGKFIVPDDKVDSIWTECPL